MDTFTNDPAADVLRRALAAFDFLSQSDVGSAVDVWKTQPTAHGLTLNEDEMVVAWANAGVANLLQQSTASAMRALLRARQLLSSHQRDTPSRLRGTSSGYHFRLAARHSDAFECVSDARDLGLRELMSSIVTHHIALLDADKGDCIAHSAMSSLVHLTFGQASAEAQLCRAETLTDIANCYAQRANKLRTILRHRPERAPLSLELAIAALAIWPCQRLLTESHVAATDKEVT